MSASRVEMFPGILNYAIARSILVPIKIRYMCADGAVIAAPLRDELPCFPVFVLLGSQVIYAVIPDFIRRRRFEVLFTTGHVEPGR